MERVLVIDDDALLRKTLIAALAEAGFAVLEASGGREGVALAEAHRPDLILCDIQMDRMNGYDVLAALRQRPATAAIPVILMTDQTEAYPLRESMNLGADDYLAKPFEPHELLTAVASRIAKQQVIRRQTQEELASLKSQIAVTLSHELRTPLQGILGSAQLMMTLNEEMEPAEVAEFSEIIYTSCKRLEHLVENLLIYAQLELQAHDEDEDAHLTGTLPETCSLLERTARELAEAHGREADLALHLTEQAAGTSAQYLKKIAAELLDNAFKFSPAGAPVTLVSGPAGACFHLAVRDEGRGMLPEEIAQVDAYVQFNRALHEQRGVGLGLRIVKRLVRLHGGTFHINSHPESATGTTFEVTLPVPADVPDPAPAAHP